jgi:prolyl-tRNA synthetase
MRMSELIGRRIKEDPRDAQITSHKFLIRGGYVRPVSAGIYSLLPLGRRITRKIEQVIREEMDAIDGQEVLMPVILPAELWKESGRYDQIHDELLRFKDRNDKDMLLAMTHEEAVVHLVRSEVNSYKQLPFMVYQIQTKYRDEARPRAGMIRVREFTMKDGYSFHENQECLEKYYDRAHKAYENIFNRLGMNNVVSIKSDSGMMGGALAHEFMAITESGEDTIFMSEDRSYKANREVAVANYDYKGGEALELEKVSTPGKKTIEEVAEFLGVKPENTGKAVFYVNENEELIFVMIRGDFEVNEIKLKNYLQNSVLEFASDEQIKAVGAEPGYASPVGLNASNLKVVVDESVEGSANLVVGANEENYHLKNFNLKRDLPNAEVLDIATVRDGDPCPVTGTPLIEYKGIEVGNIFQLGTKYSKTMGCCFLDKNGKSKPMIMGCYGIGVGRAMAAVIEQAHDDYGPKWPITVSPYQVHLCALNYKKDDVKDKANKIYDDLKSAGIEVLFDDRGEKAGFMFNDADLIGIPFRIVVSPKTLAEDKVEFKVRGIRDGELLSIDTLIEVISGRIAAEYAKYSVK